MRSDKRTLLIPLIALAVLLALRIAYGAPVFPGGGRAYMIAAFCFTAVLLIIAALIRLLAVPRFTAVPGRLQLTLEQLSCMVDGLCRGLLALIFAVGRGIRGLARGIAALPAGLVRLFTRRKSEDGRRRAPMEKRTKVSLAIWLGIVAVLFVLCLVTPPAEHGEAVGAAMRDAVLHEEHYFLLFGLKANPGLVAAMLVSGVLLFAAALIRIFAIPRFRLLPGRFQLLLEQMVRTLDGLAGSPETGKCTFVGAYVFAAGVYIFVGTLFELIGIQLVGVHGPVTLPAPLSDVNAAICMGCQSYLVILFGGITHAGMHGVTATLKEFSLPISMSFRLFGALLSGLLVTDLVYHSAILSYGLPVIIGVMFTLLHALIQTYVLTMLVGMYYGEVSEKPEPKRKRKEPPAAA